MGSLTRIMGSAFAITIFLSGATGRELSAFDQYLAMKRLYDKELSAYQATARAGFRGESSDKVLQDYQALLYDYGKSASYWSHAQLEKAPASRPPTIGLLAPRPDKPTILSVDENYRGALQIEAAMWKSSAAGFPTSVILPESLPLPPLQDSRDPRFAQLVAMRAQVNAQRQAVLAGGQKVLQETTEALARMGDPNRFRCQNAMGRNICPPPPPVSTDPSVAERQTTIDNDYRRQQEINGNLPN